MEFLFSEFLGTAVWLWLMFMGIVVFLLIFDLGVLNRKDHEIGMAESLWLSGFYIAIALIFGVWVWWYMGAKSGMDFFTGFLVEKTLALDNIFVISLIFSYFAIPRVYQHRVLFWGILGVIILRGIMIALGAALVTNFSWILYVFGIFLIGTGIKMLIMMDDTPDIANNPLLKFARRHFRITPTLHENAFFVKQHCTTTNRAEWFITPLFLALMLIEIADLIFAVDSIPAIFAITQDTYIVYTSNIFAILGLRALYFALAAMMHRFHYLKYALAILLIVIGIKILLVHFIKIPAYVSLTATVAILSAGIIYSLMKTRTEHPTA